jgi:hypothetical protein
MEGEVLILPTQPIEIFEEGHLRKLRFDLSETVKFGVDFFLNSSKAYRPYPCNISHVNPQSGLVRIIIFWIYLHAV